MKRRLITLFAITLAIGIAAMAQTASEVFYSDPYAGFNEETFMDMDFEPNLLTPVVPDKEKEAVCRHMREAARRLKGRFTVELIRDDEVMVATIQAATIFEPNDTLLNDDAENVLRPVFALMKDPMKYKVVAAMHTDDTGNELYQERLSTARLNSVYDLFMDLIDDGQVNPDIVFIPYAMGADDPVTDNDTWRHRAENRRLEIYFIPGPALIEQAHRETLAQPKAKKKK